MRKLKAIKVTAGPKTMVLSGEPARLLADMVKQVMGKQYKVAVYDAGYGRWDYIKRDLDVEQAGEVATICIESAERRKDGAIAKVVVTDADDVVSLQWELGKGIVYPTPDMLPQKPH